MEEEERVALRAAVGFIQPFDPLPGQPQQRLVLWHHLGVGVPEVGQQAEVQILVSIGQEANFQRLDQLLNVWSAGEHRWDHDQGARFRWNPAGKVQARQRLQDRQ